ncbi:MAG: radical SAM protein [Geminocystis sp.]|nr:radical SAM protein [Bacteroidia bacterium]MDW8302243.1 radical SAM protein [Bacteroidia bacterium]MDW8463857.1 radical SAM protein [Geminocystis sp.]
MRQENYNEFVARRVNLKDVVPLERPLSVYIEPTNKCTFKCISCPLSLSNYTEIRPYRTMRYEEFERIVELIREDFKRVKVLNLYMIGEPLLHKDIVKMIRKAKQEDIAERIVISTNGSLLESVDTESLLSSGVDYINISIYGADEKSFKESTNSKYSLEEILSAISKLVRLRDITNSQVNINCSIFKDENAKKIKDKLVEICDGVFEKHLMDWTEKEGSFTKNFKPLSERKSIKTCPMPFFQMVIHSDLKVSICCNDYAQRLVVGDLRNQRPVEIWNGLKWNLIRSSILLYGYKSISACGTCYTPEYAYEEDNLDELSFQTYLSRIET